MIPGIYTITNEIDGKMYIGQALDIPRRWKDHLDDLFANKHANPHLQNAFRKHGFTNFSFQVFMTCRVDSLDMWEELTILAAKDDGIELYNVKDGGNAPMTEEHKQNIGNANKGKIRSEATRLKLSLALKAYHATHDNPFKGMSHNQETREKMSKSRSGKSWTLEQYKSRGYTETDIHFAASGGRLQGKLTRKP